MPIHDWTRVAPNRFHNFHQSWTVELSHRLNGELLPPGYFALIEPSGLSLPIRTGETDAVGYARRANRLAIRRTDEELVSVVEVLSPGNKESRLSMDAVVNRAAGAISSNVHMLIVDLFPPNEWNPDGVHKPIWDRLQDSPLEMTAGKALTLVSYSAGVEATAYLEPAAVGDVLSDMPIFVTDDQYVLCPLEATYMASWNVFPSVLKGPLLLP